MDAIKLLKSQHRAVEKLFTEFEEAEEDDEKLEKCSEIADSLAVHTSIEERFFYPSVRARQTEQQIEEAFEEHLEIKKLLVDALASTDDPGFDGKVAAIKGALEHHVEEEETELFPLVAKLLAKDVLEALGQQMEAEADRMMEAGSPGESIEANLEPPSVQP